jgi:hypothetical protein
MSRLLWKIGLLRLSSRKCNFCMQNSCQTFWKHVHRFMFCNRFDPNNFRNCDFGLQTKYKLGIMQDIFPGILLIHDKK